MILLMIGDSTKRHPCRLLWKRHNRTYNIRGAGGHKVEHRALQSNPLARSVENQMLLIDGGKEINHHADEQFPLELGQKIYFWSFVVTILIFAVDAGTPLHEGTQHLTDLHSIERVLVSDRVLVTPTLFRKWRACPQKAATTPMAIMVI